MVAYMRRGDVKHEELEASGFARAPGVEQPLSVDARRDEQLDLAAEKIKRIEALCEDLMRRADQIEQKFPGLNWFQEMPSE
jgi:hypothetical protein